MILTSLNGECQEIFNTFLTKNSTCAQYKQVRQKIFCFHKDIRERRVSAWLLTSLSRCQHIKQICSHDVGVLNNYADSVSAKSLTTQTRVSIVVDADRCQHSRWLYKRQIIFPWKKRKLTIKVTTHFISYFWLGWHCHWQCEYVVRIVNDYADMVSA